MNIHALENKIELIQWFSAIDYSTIIDKLMQFKNETTKDQWNEISAEEKQSIENGINDAENGSLLSHLKSREIYDGNSISLISYEF